MATLKPNEVMTPKFRVSFPDLFEAKSFNNQEAKFGLQMLFDKKTDLSELKKVVKHVIKEKWGTEPPKSLVLPFKDGNEKELEGYQNTIVVGATSKFQPQVIDQKREPIHTPDDIYAGCFARAVIGAYAWEYKQGGKVMKRGVSFNINSVQKLTEGERFVKRVDAADLFDEVEDSSNDASNFESDDFDL